MQRIRTTITLPEDLAARARLFEINVSETTRVALIAEILKRKEELAKLQA